jgi:hypothetical protein
MKMSEDFAVFIISHARADNILTIQALDKCNYQGKLFVVVDDQDPQLSQYRETYGANLVVFNKQEVGKTFDRGDNFTFTGSPVYARNVLHQVAKEKGLSYFLVLDDDYTNFKTRCDENFTFTSKELTIDINKAITACLELLQADPRILTVCFAQSGDYMGGASSSNLFGQGKAGLLRKAMNSFLCATDRPFKFTGTLNEDATTYTHQGSLGHLFFTTNQYALYQKTTQTNPGGNTDIYLQQGTYVKSFYSVLWHPSSVTVVPMGVKNKRLHHRIERKYTYPKILSQSVKK